MSDLKHMTPDELMRHIQNMGAHRAKLKVELVAVEARASILRGQINASKQRHEWAARYMAGDVA